jgi:glucose-6-phosphate 1-dehydrogenase
MAETTTQERPGDPCTILIFGAMGDLTKRKLLPSLYNLRCLNLLPRDFAIIGFARRDLDDDGFRGEMSRAISEFATRPVDKAIWEDFCARIYFARGDFNDPQAFERLAVQVREVGARHKTGGNLLCYLASPPDTFGTVVKRLGTAGLSREEGGRWVRVVVEKPFGRDLDSALALDSEIRDVLRERQIFRIDHYLGKETVQNLLVFRFANGLFEPIWNRRYIDHVQITVAEDLGVEGRGGFYEQAGVMRDIIQNHIFQVLCLIAMEPPSSLNAEAVRNEKVKVLDAIRMMQPEEILQQTVRGQYGEGFVKNAKVAAYRSEPQVSPSSKTETYAALRLVVENWRWAGIPFYLRSGKRLAKRHTGISIQFRRPPLLLFRDAGVESIDPNRLDIHIQPEEAITIQMKAKQPGPAIRLKNVKLHFSYSDFGEQSPATGYERLLYDCMTGDTTLFHRADIVEASWRIATPVLDLWSTLQPRDFPNYAAGSWGPSAADELLAKENRRWVNPE